MRSCPGGRDLRSGPRGGDFTHFDSSNFQAHFCDGRYFNIDRRDLGFSGGFSSKMEFRVTNLRTFELGEWWCGGLRALARYVVRWAGIICESSLSWEILN